MYVRFATLLCVHWGSSRYFYCIDLFAELSPYLSFPWLPVTFFPNNTECQPSFCLSNFFFHKRLCLLDTMSLFPGRRRPPGDQRESGQVLEWALSLSHSLSLSLTHSYLTHSQIHQGLQAKKEERRRCCILAKKCSEPRKTHSRARRRKGWEGTDYRSYIALGSSSE
jgi:hypothetical protein